MHRIKRLSLIVSAMSLAMCVFVQSAFAAASTETGIDYTADLVTPVKTELKQAVLAAIAVVVLVLAVTAGIKLIRRFAKA